MQEVLHILNNLLVVFAVAGVVVYLFQLLRLPAVVGLLVAGVLIGPFLRGNAAANEEIHLLAEIGVVVLLFSVGLEFSLSRVLSMGRLMLLIGLPQVVLSIAAVALCTWGYFGNLSQAIFAGMLVAMSSTAVVIKVLADRSELDAGHGRISIAVLLLQDLLVVVFVLAVPLLAPKAAGGAAGESALLGLLGGVAVIVGILLAGKYLLPGLLYRIVRTRNRELFLIAIFLVCIGTAALTAAVGLSLALGAFLAGLMLSESEYGHQTLAEVLPFRDTLSSLFFISVGVLLDLTFLADHLPLVLGVVAGLLLLKFATATVPTARLGFPMRAWLLTGLALAQIGEFSFVLAESGRKADLLGADEYKLFLAAAVVTMGLTPFLIGAGPPLAERLARLNPLDLPGEAPARTHRHDHVIIAGYGFNGKNLALVLRDLNIPYLVLEMNPETVRSQHQAGESIEYGDCTRPAVLQHVGIEYARVFVVAISDPASGRRAVQIARQLNPNVRIVVRTRYQTEIADLYQLGADQVVPEDFETSVEVFARVMDELEVPPGTVRRLVAGIRACHYETFRGFGRVPLQLPRELRGVVEPETIILPDGAVVHGQTIGELRLRKETGASIIAIRRGPQLLPNPGADVALLAGDHVVLIGDPTQVAAAIALLDRTVPAGSPLPSGDRPGESVA